MILNTGQMRLTAVYESYILTARRRRRTPVALQGHTGLHLETVNSQWLLDAGFVVVTRGQGALWFLLEDVISLFQ